MSTSTGGAQQDMGGFLGWVERSGNKLPDPVFLFFWLIVGLVAISVVASLTGVSALHPTKIDPATGTQRVIRVDRQIDPAGLLALEERLLPVLTAVRRTD